MSGCFALKLICFARRECSSDVNTRAIQLAHSQHSIHTSHTTLLPPFSQQRHGHNINLSSVHPRFRLPSYTRTGQARAPRPPSSCASACAAASTPLPPALSEPRQLLATGTHTRRKMRTRNSYTPLSSVRRRLLFAARPHAWRGSKLACDAVLVCYQWLW